MDVQKCDLPYCTSTHLISTSVINDTDECPICMEVLDSNECAMMQGCDHICCSGCIACWMEDMENPSCPLCREISPLTIVSKTPFRGEERRALFKEHMKCQLNHPDLKPFLDNVDKEEWKTFFGFVMNSDVRLPTRYYTDDFFSGKAASLKLAKEKFFIFDRQEGSDVIIVPLRLPGLLIQVLLSNECNDIEHDRDMADKVVGHLNLQWMHSWKTIPHVLHKGPTVIMRRFGPSNCVMYLERLTSAAAKPYVESEDVVKEQLHHLPNSNLPFTSIVEYYNFIRTNFLMEKFSHCS